MSRIDNVMRMEPGASLFLFDCELRILYRVYKVASHGSTNFKLRLDATVLDLIADDNSGLQKQKSVYHWNKKSKKYVELNNGEHVTATGKISAAWNLLQKT